MIDKYQMQFWLIGLLLFIMALTLPKNFSMNTIFAILVLIALEVVNAFYMFKRIAYRESVKSDIMKATHKQARINDDVSAALLYQLRELMDEIE